MTYLTYFVFFLPKTFVDEIILVETNIRIKGPNLDFGEFLCFIGIWVFSRFSIRVSQFMSGNCFENICSDLKFTATPPPIFWDNLYEVLQMIVAWKVHRKKVFVPYWISWLDESCYEFSDQKKTKGLLTAHIWMIRYVEIHQI